MFNPIVTDSSYCYNIIKQWMICYKKQQPKRTFNPDHGMADLLALNVIQIRPEQCLLKETI